MPCDTIREPEETPEDRKRTIMETVARLEAGLSSGQVKVKVGPSGGVAFAGWPQSTRNGVTDLCAFRRLQSMNSAPLRMALARAEALAGRKADPRAIASGLHSHDGGSTWGRD